MSEAVQTAIVLLIVAGAIALLVWPRKHSTGGCGTGCSGCDRRGGTTEQGALPLVSLEDLRSSATPVKTERPRVHNVPESQQGSHP